MNDGPEIIRNFVSGKSGSWDWDNFISTSGKTQSDTLLKMFCSDLPLICPSSRETEYCSEDGAKQLLEAAAVYESGPERIMDWLESNHSQWTRSTLSKLSSQQL